MKILYRTLLFLAPGFIGLSLVTTLAGKFLVPSGSGMAGPAIALGYGAVGGLIFGLAGLFVGVKLSDKTLPRVALSVVLGAVILGVVLVMRVIHLQEAKKDPDSAYEGLTRFRLSLERIVITDPNVYVKMELDSDQRSWTMTLPDGRVCTGTMRAKEQRRIAQTFAAMAELDSDAIQQCRTTADAAEQLLVWELPDSQAPSAQGRLKLSEACLKAIPALNKAVIAARRANFSPTSPVECE